VVVVAEQQYRTYEQLVKKAIEGEWELAEAAYPVKNGQYGAKALPRWAEAVGVSERRARKLAEVWAVRSDLSAQPHGRGGCSG
jgi:hypothetical protein